jgi:hypothetical protein
MDLGLHYWNFSAPGGPQRIADTPAHQFRNLVHSVEARALNAQQIATGHYPPSHLQTTGF